MQELFSILRDCCFEFRKGPEVTTKRIGIVEVTEVFAMPHVDEASPALAQVDCHYLIIGVDPERAVCARSTLVPILDQHADFLRTGPSYITVANEFQMEQGTAFQLMALGEVLGLWDVITPARLRIEGEDAEQIAGNGGIWISTYRNVKEQAA